MSSSLLALLLLALSTTLADVSNAADKDSCGKACRSHNNCPGQLACMSGKCNDDPWMKTNICSSSGTPSTNPPSASGCPAGWQPAVGTVYDSWPKPGTTECIQYSGCKYAGQFASVSPGWGGSGRSCQESQCRTDPATGAKARCLDGGINNIECRWPESVVRGWSMAATQDPSASSSLPKLLGKKLQVMVEGSGTTVVVNVMDYCKDSDCGGCCRTNTGGYKYPLIDLEKWPASSLLGSFGDLNSRTFDINNVNTPGNNGKRPGAPSYVMPICYKVI